MKLGIFQLALSITVCFAACPFRSQSIRAAAGPTDPIVQSALQVASGEPFCGPPVCNPSSGSRMLLSDLAVEENGFPALAQATVDAIEHDFCQIMVDNAAVHWRFKEAQKHLDNCNQARNFLNSAPERRNPKRVDLVAGALQLVFHDAGTWDPANTTTPGGMDGCACDKFGPNRGLNFIKDALKPIYTKYSDYLSLADFWVIVGNAAFKVSTTVVDPHGKVLSDVDPMRSIEFKYGRHDIDCTDCSAEVAGRLPDENKSLQHVKDVFMTRMGFTKPEIVALMGAHSVGKLEALNSGIQGKWDHSPAQLDVEYYNQLLFKSWFRYAVNETVALDGQALYPDYVHDKVKVEWRPFNAHFLPCESDPRSGNCDNWATRDPGLKLLNTDVALAWNIGYGDDVNARIDAMASDQPFWSHLDIGASPSAADIEHTCRFHMCSGIYMVEEGVDVCPAHPAQNKPERGWICATGDPSFRSIAREFEGTPLTNVLRHRNKKLGNDRFISAFIPAFQKLCEFTTSTLKPVHQSTESLEDVWTE